jgi:iron complex transport system ATP-binding protein
VGYAHPRLRPDAANPLKPRASSSAAPLAAAPSVSVLMVDGLCVRRGENIILDEVTWRVERGEHWVILGANGSGKTSLLSALTAYLTPSAGTIEVLGSAYGRIDWRELRKHVGLVSSSIRQMIGGDATALDVVVSGKDATLNLHHGKLLPADCARGIAILRQIEGTKLAARPWTVLSQGERQRVLIGRALMAAPPLLILDEPCAGLDPVARERFIRFLDRLGRRRRAPALVLVTHHVEEIASVFTHALLLSAGRITAAGPIRATLTTTNLARVFRAPTLRLRRDSSGRYQLTLPEAPSSRMM